MLKGKRCLVTGASGGLGEAIALAFAKEKANLVLVATDAKALRSVAAKCMGAGACEAEIHAVDLLGKTTVNVLSANVLKRHGRVDVLVNCPEVADADWQSAVKGDLDGYSSKIFAANLTVPMRLTKLFSPKMIESKSGAIINVSNIYGTVPSVLYGAYTATMHGVNGWSHSCSRELRPHGIKVVCVQLGPVMTDMMRKASNNPDAGGFDMNLGMEPEDVAEACMLAIRTSQKCFPEEIILSSSIEGHS